jgi:hypothetical protein
MGLTGDPLFGEVGGIVIGSVIIIFGLLFGFSSVAADDKYSDSPIPSAVTGRGRGKSRGKSRGKKRKNTKKKR